MAGELAEACALVKRGKGYHDFRLSEFSEMLLEADRPEKVVCLGGENVSVTRR